MKFQTLSSLSSALVLSTCACLAQAGTAWVSQAGGALTLVSNSGSVGDAYALGALDTPFSSVFVTLNSPGSFSEYATLSIPAGFGGAEGAFNTYALEVQLPTGPVVVGGIGDFAVTVFGGTPSSPGAQFGSYLPGTTFSLPAASAGDYFLRFTGTVNGVGGQYSAAMFASPVPEPSIYLMALLGLGVLAWRVPRNRR